MCEKFGIDDKTRFLVLYFDAKLNGAEISKIVNRPVRTIRRWQKISNNGGDIRLFKQGKGPKGKKITEETENKVIQMVNEHPEGASTKRLAARIGISASSIRQVLTRKGFRYKTLDKTIIYAEQERLARVEFCNKMLSDEGKLIYRTFFSDEMAIELNKTHKTKAWQLPTEKIRKKNVTDYVKLHCWGAISAQGATSLDIYDKGMNGDYYQQVIKRHKAEMGRLYSDGEFYFLQDNHPAHRMNEEWIIKEQELKLIKMPKRSPDLNIIENLWSALKDKVAFDAAANEKELRASLLRNWESLTRPYRLQPFFEGLHRKYIECVAKEGNKVSW